MGLPEDLRDLRDRVLADLNKAHDYHTDTVFAWNVVAQFIRAGNTFALHNIATGTVTTQAELAAKARDYEAEQLAEATFHQFISLFENFLFDFLRHWLLAYPQSLTGKQVSFKDVLEAMDKDALTLLVVNKELNEVLYKRPSDWFAYLEDRTKLGCPAAEEIERIAEAKASRDVLTHNRGVANKVYEAKTGRLARYRDGEKINIPEDYHLKTWELIRKVVTDIANAAIAK
jgi:hypothetical protein